MRARRALVLIVLLAIQTFCVFGDDVVFYPNPIGEELYRKRLFMDVLPGVVIACALLLAWLLHAFRRRATTPAPDATEYDGSYDI